MATTIAAVSIQVSANPSGAIAGLRSAQGALIQFESTTRSVMDRVKGYLATIAVGKGLQVAVGAAASLEKYQVAFQGLIGDVQKGTKLFEELWQFSLRSPLSVDAISNAAKRLLGYGVEADKIIGIVRQLSDVAMGNSETFDLLAMVYGQITSAGKLMGQDLNQISTHFNILGQLAKMTGLQVAELRKAMHDGAITSQMVATAFEAATLEGGRFFQATENYMRTTEGQWMNFKKQVLLVAISIGEILRPAVVRVMAVLTSFAQSLQGLDSDLKQGAVQVMAWVASLAAVVYIGTRVIAMYRAMVVALKALTAAETIAQAMSGPKGWATLAAGAFVAGASLAAIDSLFEKMEKSVANVSEETQNVGGEIDKLFDPLQKFKGSTEEVDKEFEKMEKHAAKLEERFEHAGEALRKSVRTPAEVLAETIQEMVSLFDREFISAETLRRGLLKARKEFSEAVNKGEKQEGKGVAAATLGTTAGFSAVQEAVRIQSNQARTLSRQLREQEKANAILAQIARNTSKPPVEVKQPPVAGL